ncbi:MAG: cysteine hydrolase family protein, partial [Frankia sp.]
LVADVQVGGVKNYALHPGVVENIAVAVQAARQAEVQVIYTQLVFREGYPEAHPRNRVAAQIATAGIFTANDPMAAIDPRVAPGAGDIVLTKSRVSAFAAGDLDLLLRSMSVHTLVRIGIATSGVVLSSFLDALDRDYSVTVLADACSDRDLPLHDMIMRQIFGNRATVSTVKEYPWPRAANI